MDVFKSIFFNTIKEINGLRKENKCQIFAEKLLLRKIDVLKTSIFEVEFTKISLNFKTFCCNLKIRDLGAKLCVAFPLV